MSEQVDDVTNLTKLVWTFYQTFLDKSGKPKEGEWTSLAAIVREDTAVSKSSLKVVALATGTKCVTANPIEEDGNLLIDCHAESLLKRAFKRYLIFELNQKTLKLTDSVKFHLFISQLPCGTVERYKGSESTDSVGLREVRRKPGKGQRCSKVSCVDKIAKWSQLGVQGRRLTGLTKSLITFDSIVIGNCVENQEFDEEVLRSAIACSRTESFDSEEPPIKKVKSSSNLSRTHEVLIKFDEQFKKPELTRTDKLRASNCAIVSWREGLAIKKEVVASGRKLGATNKTWRKCPLLISNSKLTEDIESLKTTLDCDFDLVKSVEELWSELRKTQRFQGWNNLVLNPVQDGHVDKERSE